LDMRMDPTRGESAAEWLARVGQAELERVLREYGEEPRARAIAAAIVRARRDAPLTTTTQLADVIARAAGRGKPKPHPATRAFQAIRIAVNRELDALEEIGRASCRERV